MIDRIFMRSIILACMIIFGCSKDGDSDRTEMSGARGNVIISGDITGDVTEDVSVNLSGEMISTTKTNASGHYAFKKIRNGTYTITPSMDGYVFYPGSRTVVVAGRNVSADFISSRYIPPTYSKRIAWDAPVINRDGTPCLDLAGFKVYEGSSAGSYQKVRNVGMVLSCDMSGPEGSYYVVVTAYDKSGNESYYSNEIIVKLP